MSVPFLDLKVYNRRYEDEVHAAVERVIRSGWYLFGAEKKAFEREFSEYIGVKETIGVGSGLDALKIILKAYRILEKWEEGDEIVVPANTFIASILAIVDTGLKPVLVEPDENTFNIDPDLIEKKISSHTKAIMIVHLYGQNAINKKVEELCESYDLKLIEDAAQAHGASYEGKRIGSLGDAAAFSFYPGKNLGAMGDAGAICTDNLQLASCCRALSNYGGEAKYKYKYKGFNSRLDEIQAAILRIKLKGLDADNKRRMEIANYYLRNISNPGIKLPAYRKDKSHVWHLFVVRVKNRNEFIQYLNAQGVEASVHYPIPPNGQEGYPELQELHLPLSKILHQEVVSLPMNPTLGENELKKVVKAVENYQAEGRL